MALYLFLLVFPVQAPQRRFFYKNAKKKARKIKGTAAEK